MMSIPTATQPNPPHQAKARVSLLTLLRKAVAATRNGRLAAFRSVALLKRVANLQKIQGARPKGPLPRWLDDPQLTEQLLKDTGLTIEDLLDRPLYDEDLPFFMQRRAGHWG